MVGFVIVTHHQIGKEILKTVEEIIQDKPQMRHVSITAETSFQDSQQKIYQSIQSLSEQDGIILLVDLFGATPANLCKEYLKNGEIEMITGCNLPMILKAATTEFKESPSQVAQFLKNYAKDSIRVYSTDF